VFVIALRLDFESNALAGLSGFVSPERVQRATRYHSRKDAIRTLAGEALSRAIVMQVAGVENDEIGFVMEPTGKPKLNGRLGRLHFSLSHSGSWVLCGIGDVEMGVDVEMIRDIDPEFVMRPYPGFNWPELPAREETGWRTRFFLRWTLMESRAKSCGAGLVSLLDPAKAGGWSHAQYLSNDGYAAAVCSAATSFPDRIPATCLDDVLSMLGRTPSEYVPRLAERGIFGTRLIGTSLGSGVLAEPLLERAD